MDLGHDHRYPLIPRETFFPMKVHKPPIMPLAPKSNLNQTKPPIYRKSRRNQFIRNKDERVTLTITTGMEKANPKYRECYRTNDQFLTLAAKKTFKKGYINQDTV